MKYTKSTLPSGLRVILAPMTDTETVTVLVMTGVGSRFESRAENGLAHFLEHMFFKGTEKRPTAMDISHELDAIGAEYNAYTGKDRTAYYAKVAAPHAGIALDVVSDIFLHAKIEQEEIDRERGAILQEINMYEDMPMRHLNDLWELHLYGDTPLGWEIVGPKSNIKKFTREEFIAYLDRGYVASNVVVGVAGKFDPKEMKKMITAKFKTIREGKKPTFTKIKEAQTKPEVYVQHKATDQTHMLLGVRTVGMYHADRPALTVLATLLGGGMSSRLFMQVRERRGLAYSVHTGTEYYAEAGYLATQAGVEHENMAEATRVILEEYQKLTKELVPAVELKKAKEYIKGKMVMGLEGSDSVVEYLVTQECVRGEVVLPKDRAREIDKVTAEDIRRVAKKIFTDKRLNMAVIGPKTTVAELSKLVRFAN